MLIIALHLTYLVCDQQLCTTDVQTLFCMTIYSQRLMTHGHVQTCLVMHSCTHASCVQLHVTANLVCRQTRWESSQ